MSNSHIIKRTDIDEDKKKILLQKLSQRFIPSISLLKFPFALKQDQIAAVNAWINNNNRGTILYSTGTGKTEIAFECARRLVGQLLLHKRRGSPSKMDEVYSTDLISNDDKNTT